MPDLIRPITLNLEQMEESEMLLRAMVHFKTGIGKDVYLLAADCLRYDRAALLLEQKYGRAS